MSRQTVQKMRGRPRGMHSLDITKGEIIGNVFQNPELLKEAT